VMLDDGARSRGAEVRVADVAQLLADAAPRTDADAQRSTSDAPTDG
jgi:hypothetical protein